MQEVDQVVLRHHQERLAVDLLLHEHGGHLLAPRDPRYELLDLARVPGLDVGPLGVAQGGREVAVPFPRVRDRGGRVRVVAGVEHGLVHHHVDPVVRGLLLLLLV